METAEDGEQGWVALSDKHYDLLLTDNEMPRLRGLALVHRVRAAGMALPVIVVSGSEEARRSEDNSFLGLSAVVSKPFDPEKFLAVVERASGSGACGRHSMARAASTPSG